MEHQTAWDYLAAFVTIAALAIGLISMAIGQIQAWRERHARPTPHRWRHVPARRARPPLRTDRWFAVVRRAHEPVRIALEPAEPGAVRAQQNQLEPVEPAENEPAREPLQLNRLSRESEIALLAVQRNEDGSYRHSANDITKFIGGTAADVKKQVAAIRGSKPAEQVSAARVERPSRGWPKTA